MFFILNLGLRVLVHVFFRVCCGYVRGDLNNLTDSYKCFDIFFMI